MLKTYEAKNLGVVLVVAKKKITKEKGKKGNTSRERAKAPVENESEDKKDFLANMVCFYCKGKGHYKRNCHKYLNDKKSGTSTSGIHLKISSLYLST